MTTTTKPMDDRDLLELAAKAAGIAITQCTCRNENYPFRHDESVSGKYGHWNPLLKDGDALRLAVNLRLDIQINCDEAAVISADVDGWVSEPVIDEDIGAATRRAIVRAAAEIARQEKDHDR